MKLPAAIVWLLLLVGAYRLGAQAPARTEPEASPGTSFESTLDPGDPLSQ